MKRLEIGSGNRPTPGYDHLDVKKFPHIEYVCDARKLPFDDNTYDEVYNHWVLEHFAWREMVNLLKEWKRVLKPNGILKIITNNQEAINKCLQMREISWEEWSRLTFGSNTNSLEGCHKIGLSLKSLMKFLEKAGFDEIEIEAQWKCREDNGKIKCPGLIAMARKPK